MDEVLNILMIEDNESDAALVIRQLEKAQIKYHVVRVESGEELSKVLGERHWDIVVADYSLPQFNAPAALKIVREADPEMPFIVVSGTIGEESAVYMMKAGAQDYLMKDRLTRLVPAIRKELAEARMRKEHSRALSDLKESEVRFRAVFENSYDAIGVSRQGKHIFVNAAYLKLFGFTHPSQIDDFPVLELIGHSERKRIGEYIQKRNTSNELPQEYITKGLRVDGTEFDMDVKVSVFEFQGQMHTLVMLRDITHRILEQQELKDARDKAEDANRMKSSLMMNLSHEVRTPMNSIIGFSSLMMTEFDNPEVKMMASRILGAGNRLLKTLDDILELTQLQSGIEPWKLGVVDLEADVSKLIDKFHEEAESKGLLMEFRSSASSSMAVPRDLVSKAIGELISNAIKFTGNGRIRVCLEDFFENGRRNARVLVSDTGIGIEPENHEVVFESFRQLSTGYGRSHEGSGLGLTLARKIAEILGGSLTLMSKPGEGSTFTLILPLSENGILKEPVKFEPRPDEIIRQRQSVTRPEILLVEDNEDNILVVREFLKKDYSITAVNSGDEAISVARSKQFDLVLMDINLGVGTDGLSAAREIKSKGASQAAIIVAITGYTLKDDMDRILSQGCDYYLGKPFSRSQIKGLLQQLV